MGLDPRFNRVDSVLLELPYDGLLGMQLGGKGHYFLLFEAVPS